MPLTPFSFPVVRSLVTRCALSLAPALLLACGGAAPEPQTPASSMAGGAPPSASPSSTPAAPGENVRASTVRFDDLGIGFTVPPGYRVLGDEELAARVQANGDLRLNRSLRDRAKQKKFLPLLTLEKQSTDPNDFVNLSLGVVLVPKDATAAEVLTQQEALMKEHLASFQVIEPSKGRSIGNVQGAELVSRSMMKRGGEARRVASLVRVFVRDGVATVATAVWPDGAAPRGEEARLVLDSLSFYDGAPGS